MTEPPAASEPALAIADLEQIAAAFRAFIAEVEATIAALKAHAETESVA